MLVYKSFPQGCSFYDVVLNFYLSLNLMPKFIIDNNIKDINLMTTAGQEFLFDTDFIFDEFMSNEVLKHDYKFCTGELIINNQNNPATSGKPHLLIESGDVLASESTNFYI